MAPRAGKHRVVVDGSNLATEGRTEPSLQQLDEAVRAYVLDNPKAEVIVVVDASFDHRIAANERSRFKEAELAGEVVTTPAGAIGRGDAFILKIADRIGAVVLSNDSFQEFHLEYPWLFEEGRLIGGKPIPSVGWVFTERQPVRGSKSVKAVKKLEVPLPSGVKPKVGTTLTPVKAAAKKAEKAPAKAPALKAEKHPAKAATKAVKKAAKTPAKSVAKLPAKSTAKKAAKTTVKKTSSATPALAGALRRGRQPVNPERDFVKFTAAHRLRSMVEGEVVAFSSHGAIIAVDVDKSRKVECYAPTTSLGTPPPARARDVLKRGDRRNFRLVSVDRERRIAELALI